MLTLGLSIVLSASFLLWSQSFWNNLLLEEYAVCADAIYTVDDLHPTVDCIAVRGSFISDTGTLGPSPAHS